jgi:hypothetical protein
VVLYWLQHYATRWKVIGLISNELTGFLNMPKPPSSRIMALVSTQPLIKLSTTNLLLVKGSKCLNLIIATCEATIQKV